MGFMRAVGLAVGALLLAIAVAYFRGYGMRPKDYPPGSCMMLKKMYDVMLTLEWIERTAHIAHHWQPPPDANDRPPSETARVVQEMYDFNDVSKPLLDLAADSSDQIVRELIDKRSGIYSGRMDVFIREFGEDLNILMKDNDEVWRRQRKMYHLRLNVNVANRYIPYQEFETTQLLHDILNFPENYQFHTKRFTTSIASTIIYGWRTTSVDLPHVKKMSEWIEGYAVAAGRLQLMDWWPELRTIFRHAPSWITGISKEMERLRNLEDELWMSLLNETKASIEHGSQKASFCTDMVLHNDVKADSYLSDKQMAANAGHAFAGTTDTTLNTTLAFIKAMMLYPRIQAKAQEEIDRVVGPERMPSWEDWDNLPYIRAVMKETLRWMPTTILGGMPHRLSKTDNYEGYTIPSNAGVMINVWAINNDERRAINPREFDPSRYEGDDLATGESAALGDATKRDHFTFGAGRRICPGLHVAERSMFITMARLLWSFNITRPTDSEGNFLPVDRDAITPGFIVSPVPFKCNFAPRDTKRAMMIQQSWQDCQHFLDKEGNYTEEFFAKSFGSE
ncbi:uncharacterized protein E0L32_002471 [Thyridium curvatum]|uniref:Cytochrome P450 n=1 Tax=Thyridium curvatum TaxID=1093900 RepID=A0A507BIM3_9PEZI|nr:uncharacterized protein E0L32_002471 [Thyridium curvatum]TPX18614.1 hypothetical protein E0L32_002471 [Thyridium curvatum]